MQFDIKDSGGRSLLVVQILGVGSDPDWLQASLNYEQNGFTANVEFYLLIGELVSFREQLSQLYTTLKGKTVFGNVEDNVSLTFTTDGIGHIKIVGYIRDSNYMVKTDFEIQSDQTMLPEILNDCKKILDHYSPQKIK